MFEPYQKIIREYKKLPLKQERKLIVLAQKGNSSAQSELLLHLIGFFLFRIKTTLYPSIVKQYGEDILQDCLCLAVKKISTYNLKYKNKTGKSQPVNLSTYMWKSITGLMLTSVVSIQQGLEKVTPFLTRNFLCVYLDSYPLSFHKKV